MERVLTADAIFEASQYKFSMEKMKVFPKPAKIPSNENKSKVILELESPFKTHSQLTDNRLKEP